MLPREDSATQGKTQQTDIRSLLAKGVFDGAQYVKPSPHIFGKPPEKTGLDEKLRERFKKGEVPEYEYKPPEITPPSPHEPEPPQPRSTR